MSDRILVQRIAVFAHHGALPEEKRLGQRFYVSLACTLDLGPAGRSDDLKRTVNYGKLTQLVLDASAKHRHRLIESLAETVADAILGTFAAINEVVVTVEKPSAPVPAIIDGIAVEIRRHRRG